MVDVAARRKANRDDYLRRARECRQLAADMAADGLEKTATAVLDAAITYEGCASYLSPRVPYPEFCRHPDQCAGLSNCPRDPCCCD